ncbi:MAG: hypothetical protein OYG31_02645 [Candidatus Kaiserbacteria bacterium]|nr:hypothetical protein [Candidatus Kaiserbacteria bacterium]
MRALGQETAQGLVAVVTFFGTLLALLFAVHAVSVSTLFEQGVGAFPLGISLLVPGLIGLVWWLSPLRPKTEWWLIGIAFGIYLSALFAVPLGAAILAAFGVYELFLMIGLGIRATEFIATFLCFPIFVVAMLALLYVLGAEDPVTVAMLKVVWQRTKKWTQHNASCAWRFVRQGVREGSRTIAGESREMFGDLREAVTDIRQPDNWRDISLRGQAASVKERVCSLSMRSFRQQAHSIGQVLYHGALRIKETLF